MKFILNDCNKTAHNDNKNIYTIRQDVLAIMCDFVLANEIEMIATARPRDEDTWDGGWHLAETRPCTFELL